MKKSLIVLTCLVACLILLAGCQRGSSNKDIPDIGLKVSLSPEPPSVGLATITIDLTNAGNQPIPGATLELEGNMSHAGMTPIFSTATETEPGRYEAPLEFTMGGDWFILIKATLPDGRTLERQVDVPGVKSR